MTLEENNKHHPKLWIISNKISITFSLESILLPSMVVLKRLMLASSVFDNDYFYDRHRICNDLAETILSWRIAAAAHTHKDQAKQNGSFRGNSYNNAKMDIAETAGDRANG